MRKCCTGWRHHRGPSVPHIPEGVRRRIRAQSLEKHSQRHPVISQNDVCTNLTNIPFALLNDLLNSNLT